MTAFVIRRFLGMIAVLFAVSILVFLIFIIVPGGDPASRIAGKHPTPQNVVNIKKKWGFDKPFYVQYYEMMRKVGTGLLPGNHSQYDVLRSFDDQTNVVHEIKKGMPATFSLTIGAGLIWLFWGVMVGVLSAITAGRWADRMITTVALVGISMPVFWLGIITRYFLAEKPSHPWFPDGGYVPLTASPWEWYKHLILPWFVLAVLFIGFYGRVLRSNILDTINEDYVRTARAKGLTPRRVLAKHVLRNSLIPVVTLFGLDFGAAVGGTVILIEPIFGIEGVGQYAQESVAHLDLPPLMALTLYGAFFVVIANTIVDVAYVWLDPRTRIE